MQYLREKLASLLNKAARDGIKELDKDSDLAIQLKSLDIDAVLENDIKLLCEKISFFELTRILALMAQLKVNSKDNQVAKKKLKDIARDIMCRIEKQSAGFKTPASCRDLLFNFLK